MVRVLYSLLAVELLLFVAGHPSFAQTEGILQDGVRLKKSTIAPSAVVAGSSSKPLSRANEIMHSSSDNPQDLFVIDVLPDNGYYATGASATAAPAPSFRYQRVAYLITPTEMAASGFPVGQEVKSIGYTLYFASPTVTPTGAFKVYLQNTTDATYTLGTTWATIISGMTLAHDGNITIPTALAPYDVPFENGTSFAYTGGGLYVAFEYQYPSGTLSSDTYGYLIDYLAGTSYRRAAQSTSALPSTLTSTNSTIRPATRMGYLGGTDILRVPHVYALGKMPIPYANPQTISAPVTNLSASPSTFDLTLSVKDVAGTVRFTDTQSGVSVDPGVTQVVSFAPWSPSITEADSVIVETSAIPGEDSTGNNRAVMVQDVNTHRFSYSQGSVASGGVGFTGATGDFVAKFSSGTNSVIDSIQVNFSASGQPYQLGIWDATGAGNTPGLNLFTSPTYTSATGVVTIPVEPPVAVNGLFFLGVRQTGTTNVSFSFQTEDPIRPETFYYTSPTGGTTWTDFSPGSPFRFMIEANIALGTQMAYSTSTTTQNTGAVLPGSTNEQVIGMEVVTTGNLIPLNVSQFNLSTNGSTNPAGDISNAKIYCTGANPVFSPINQFGATVASPSGPIVITGSRNLVQGTNHFWLTYDLAPGATPGNVIDGEFTSVTVNAIPETPIVTAPAGNRLIKVALAAGDYTIGGPLFSKLLGREVTFEKTVRKVMREVPVEGSNVKDYARDHQANASLNPPGKTRMVEVDEVSWTLMDGGKPFVGRPRIMVTDADRAKYGLGDHVLAVYPTITAALADLNFLGISGPVRFLLMDPTYPTETFPLLVDVLNNVPTSTNTVTFKPGTGVTTTVAGSFAGPIFEVFNTNDVTIDGSNTIGGTTRDMTIQNTSTSAPQVVVFGSSGTTPVVGDALKNCIAFNGSTGSSAVILSDGATIGTSGYFNDIALVNNKIRNAYIGTYINAVATGTNGSGLTVTGNDLTNTSTDSIRYIGLYVQGVNGGSIASNDIGGFKIGDGEIDRGMWIASGTNNMIIEKNKIHDLAYTDTFGYGPKGIAISTTLMSSNITIKNNMIYGIRGDGDSYAVSGGTYCPIGIYEFGTRQAGVGIYDNSIYLSGNAINYAGAYSIGICLDDSCAATIKGNVVLNNLGLLGAKGVGAVAIALEIDSTQLTASNYNDFISSSTGSGVNLVGKKAASDYSTLAAWRTASAQDANSKSADPLFVDTTDLHITNPASPASNAGTPIAGVTDDIDGDLRNATTPDIGADEFAGSSTVNINTVINNGWNMISNAVTNPVPDDSAKHLFPTLVPGTHVFLFNGGYLQRDTMVNGIGYWGKFPGATTNTMTGTLRTRDSISVLGGWNMVGSISNPVDTATVIQVPGGLKASAWFGFGAGYLPTTPLVPGKAYWIKANFAGKFVLANPLAGAAKTQAGGASALDALNTLTVTDSKGGSQTLYFGADAKNEIQLSLFEMPPAPPTGALDARFETSAGGSLVQTHAAKVTEAAEFPVRIQSDGYPVTVTWKINGGTASYELTDGLGNKVFPAKEMSGEGRIKITNSGMSKVVVRLVGDGTLPAEYALSQNYPNPFNPTTSIKYALPVDSRVTVQIYNVLGQRVRTLVNDDVPAGYHIAEWNSVGNDGQQLGSGVYLLQLSAKGTNGKSFNEVRKLMLLK